MKRNFFLLLTGIMVFSACRKDDHNTGDHDKFRIFPGPPAKVFDGKAWTWVQLDKTGKPERVAISITDEALASAEDVEDDPKAGHQHENNIVLEFHPKADATIYRHVWLNWNPAGHPPPGIYDLPHFDIHFYTVGSDERETFLDSAKLNSDLAADYLPPNYAGGDVVPAMGKHYVDLTSPEFHGQRFTQTVVYGSYDSKFVFLEPMITLDFFKATTNFERSIPQPAKFQSAGYYPTKMRVTKTNGVTNVILEAFVLRAAS
jgi:hypothetical protein